MTRDAIHEEYLPDHNLDESQMLHFSKVLVRESGAISSSSAFFSRLGGSPNLSSYFLGMSKFAGLSYPVQQFSNQLGFVDFKFHCPLAVQEAAVKQGTSRLRSPKLALQSQHLWKLTGALPGIASQGH